MSEIKRLKLNARSVNQKLYTKMEKRKRVNSDISVFYAVANFLPEPGMSKQEIGRIVPNAEVPCISIKESPLI